MGIMTTQVVGAIHHVGARSAIAALRRGQPLMLVREPKNPYDRNAVAVCTPDFQMLGYVPRADAPTVARVMDYNLPVEARCALDGLSTIRISWGDDCHAEATI